MPGSALAGIQLTPARLTADTSATTPLIVIWMAVRTQRLNCPATAP